MNIQQLRNLKMTTLEYELKKRYVKQANLPVKVLSSEEMSDYILWMMETSDVEQRSENIAFPDMLTEEIGDIVKAIQANPTDPEAKIRLTALYMTSQETDFFNKNHDISCGRFLRWLPAYWRSDEYFEVYYAFSGESPVSFENETIILKPGEVLLIPPGIIKACTLPSDKCSVLFFMIRQSTFSHVFWSHLSSRNLMSHFFSNALGGSSKISYLKFETGCDEWIETLLFRIYSECSNHKIYSAKLTNALMSAFFLSLLQDYEDTASVSKNSNMHWKSEFSDILRYVEDHYAMLTLRQLASEFGYSERQMIRILYTCTGCRFSEIQKRLKMENAARMMTQGISTEKACAATGFTNLSSFYRAFSKYFGCTTREYLRKKDSTEYTQLTDFHSILQSGIEPALP